MEDLSKVAVERGSSRSGGGWPALVADVRGVGHPATAALLAAVADPDDRLGPWCRSTLDAAWQAAQPQGGRRLGIQHETPPRVAVSPTIEPSYLPLSEVS
jgi:hypothetical protein